MRLIPKIKGTNTLAGSLGRWHCWWARLSCSHLSVILACSHKVPTPPCREVCINFLATSPRNGQQVPVMPTAGEITMPGLGPAWTARAQSMEIFGANEDLCSRVFSPFSGLSLLALSGHLAQKLSLQCFTPLCVALLGFTGSDQGPPLCHRICF